MNAEPESQAVSHGTRDWKHSHVFDTGNPLGERRTWIVVALTATMMVVEIVAGWWFNSMALFADGWHMSTHAVALGVTGMAYRLARRYSHDHRFAFGTYKVEVLGGFASALMLAGVALFMVFESVERMLNPLPIRFNQAILVAVIGLAVNLISAWLLEGDGHHHHHDHGHEDHGHAHAKSHAHGDLNLRAAYLHVLADAMTSLLAIGALLGGKYLLWTWLDPLMGIAGAILVSVWAVGLLRSTSRVLLDREMDCAVAEEIREALEADGQTRICDLHVWRVARDKFACIASIVTPDPKDPEHYKALLRIHEELAHITIEVNPAGK